MIIFFWILLFIIVYCYFGYPVLIALLARLKPNPIHKAHITPTVSIIISLYNEEDVIASKIKNLLELNYPSEKIEILIGSDGSTDRTHEIVRQFSNPRIKLFINSQRQGKITILNTLIPQSNSEIIIFTDARQIFEKEAVQRLINNFADPKIGCVSGELIFAPKEGGTAQGVGLYWTYEKFIRFQESKMHSMLGATGAIYAIRRKLFTPGLNTIVLDDMYIPLKIIKQGYRAVFDDTAHAYDQVASNPKEEYRRKIRTLSGNYQIFSIFPDLFNPGKSPIALQLFSHKFLRVIVPFLLIILFLVNYILRDQYFFDMFFVLEVIFYSMALAGYLTQDLNKEGVKFISKICYVPYIFCLLNFCALVGFWRFITAKQQITWQKARDL